MINLYSQSIYQYIKHSRFISKSYIIGSPIKRCHVSKSVFLRHPMVHRTIYSSYGQKYLTVLNSCHFALPAFCIFTAFRPLCFIHFRPMPHARSFFLHCKNISTICICTQTFVEIWYHLLCKIRKNNCKTVFFATAPLCATHFRSTQYANRFIFTQFEKNIGWLSKNITVRLRGGYCKTLSYVENILFFS